MYAILSLPLDILNEVSLRLNFVDLIELRLTHTDAQDIQRELFNRIVSANKKDEIFPIIADIRVDKLISIVASSKYDYFCKVAISNTYFDKKIEWLDILNNACKVGCLQTAIAANEHLIEELSSNYISDRYDELKYCINADIRTNAISNTCIGGHVNALDYLLPYCERVNLHNMLMYACIGEKLDILKYLYKKSIIDIEFIKIHGVPLAISLDRKNILEWMTHIIQ